MSHTESRMAGIFGSPVVREWERTWPERGGREQRAASDVTASGVWCSLDSELVERVEAELAEVLGVEHVILCSSGRTAIEAIAHAEDLLDGEVITPVGTFTAGGLLRAGAWPKVVDVGPNWTIDLDELEAAIGPDTVAIMPVSGLYDHTADMAGVLDIGHRKRLPVYNDATQVFGGVWRGDSFGPLLNSRPLVKYGKASALSFQADEVVSAGDLGAVATDDDGLAKRARAWVDGGMLGGNARPSVWAAAVLEVGLRRVLEQHQTRERLLPRMRGALDEFGLVSVADPADGDRLPQYGLTALIPDGALAGLHRDLVGEALGYLLKVVVQRPNWGPWQDPKWDARHHNPRRQSRDPEFQRAMLATLEPKPGWQHIGDHGIVIKHWTALNEPAPEALYSGLDLVVRLADNLRHLEPRPLPVM